MTIKLMPVKSTICKTFDQPKFTHEKYLWAIFFVPLSKVQANIPTSTKGVLSNYHMIIVWIKYRIAIFSPKLRHVRKEPIWVYLRKTAIWQLPCYITMFDELLRVEMCKCRVLLVYLNYLKQWISKETNCSCITIKIKEMRLDFIASSSLKSQKV